MRFDSLFALSLAIALPQAGAAQDAKATQDPSSGQIRVFDARRTIPVQLTSTTPIRTDVQKSFQNAAERCAELYSHIMDYRTYPKTVALCVEKRMHLNQGSTVHIVPDSR